MATANGFSGRNAPRSATSVLQPFEAGARPSTARDCTGIMDIPGLWREEDWSITQASFMRSSHDGHGGMDECTMYMRVTSGGCHRRSK